MPTSLHEKKQDDVSGL